MTQDMISSMKTSKKKLEIFQKNENSFTNLIRNYSKIAKEFEEAYNKKKEIFLSKKLPNDVDSNSIFPSNELDLSEVEVYGFDYDYTLASYKPRLQSLLYKHACKILIDELKYPKKIADMKYLPKFPIRGLHFDINKGLLFKLDSFLQIEPDAVYRGLTKLPESEVLNIYPNRTLAASYVEHKQKMRHIADLFSIPEICLLCNVTQHFDDENIFFHPQILFNDVIGSIGKSHGIMHKIVMNDPKSFISVPSSLEALFQKLIDTGKKLFLLTNSPFDFVNKGMTLIAGVKWRNYFDLIIVRANKPSFFSEFPRPFREFDVIANSHLWDRVTSFEKGKVYYEGTVRKLEQYTGWKGRKILYFGDHPYSDLEDLTLQHGWRTGAIIRELDDEINIRNTAEYKKAINWYQMLTNLIEEYQSKKCPETNEIFKKWLKEREELKNEIFVLFNEAFGSVFRTQNNYTYFSRRLFRLCDIYTSNIANLSNYSPTHIFYPRRGVLPHEFVSYFL